MTSLDSLLPLELFPVNGLDRSLHAPVLVGLLVLTAFAEFYGWTYAGLVVPGYLAAVFVAAPVTGALVCIEALLTYLLCELCGRWLPRWGVWSTTFGRERFFLFIVNAVLVRLTVEGLLVPWLAAHYEFAHSRELYSLGLVLVPLVANAFWNAGFWVSAPRVAAATAITYGCVALILLPYTNFTTSRFEIANESVSLAFLESPHAHIILLTGALLGARNNVRYGWDYNGILVPALLAVAWYQPTKLATTVIEALLVYGCSRAITARGPLSRVLIVGSRRVLVTYLVGFALKVVLGFTLEHVDRSVQMVDYFGFGYLLPTLLAVKMWNKDKIGPVIMPTLQVSVMAFLVGNALGFALTTLDSRLAWADTREAPVGVVTSSTARALMLADTAPAPRADRDALATARTALQVARAARGGSIDRAVLGRVAEAGLVLSRDVVPAGQSGSAAARGGSEWITVGPRSSDPNDDRLAPRFAVRRRDGEPREWMIVVTAERAASPAVVIATELAEVLGAQAIVVRSRLPELQGYDDEFAVHLAETLDVPHLLRMQLGAASPRLSVVGALPGALDVRGLGRVLGGEVQLSWRGVTGGDLPRYENAPLLELPAAPSEALAARLLGAPELESWPGGVVREVTERAPELTTPGVAGYQRPSIEELRLFGAALVPRARAWRRSNAPSPWERAVAGLLGYRLARIGEAPEGWALFEPPGPERRGNATWVVRAPGADEGARDGELLIAAPSPRVASGTVAASAALTAGLGARSWLLFGALPDDVAPTTEWRVERVRSFYQRVQEGWLDGGGRVVAVQGVASERELAGGALLSFGVEARSVDDAPSWTAPLRSLLESSGVRLLAFDGTADTVPYKGSHDPLLAYAARFADGNAALLWLTSDVRLRTMRVREERATRQRLQRWERELPQVRLASFATELARCTAWPPTQPEDSPKAKGQMPPAPPHPNADGDPVERACLRALADDKAGCDAEDIVARLESYAAEENPYLLRSVLLDRPWCQPEVVEDETTGLLWGVTSRSGRVWLVPLEGELEGTSSWLTSPEEVQRASALGLSSLRVRAPGGRR